MNPVSPRLVRRAVASDSLALAQLRFDFRATLNALVEERPAFVERCARWMCDRLTADGQWRAWIADDGANEPIGSIWLQLIDKLPNPVDEPEVHAYVTNFFVRSDRRSSGVGSELMQALLRDCDSLGVDSVFLWPTPQSVAFYERHGFSARSGVLTRGR